MWRLARHQSCQPLWPVWYRCWCWYWCNAVVVVAAYLLASSLPRLPRKRRADCQLTSRYKEHSFQLHTVSMIFYIRSTQPSTLHGTVEWVWALGLSNNKMVMVYVDGSCHFFPADSQCKSVGLVWGLAASSALSLHSLNEPGELSQWLCHDDRTINIILVIIIIICDYVVFYM